MTAEVIKLSSSRLFLIPLTCEQVVKYSVADPSLEAELRLLPQQRIMPPELEEALEETILPALKLNPGAFLFSTLWIIVSKKENMIVGDFCFKGPPNEEGEIEIGYGTYPAFFNKGYMSEAIGEVILWAFQQPGITTIIAETDKFNVASQKVLVKNQFLPTRETATMKWWKRQKISTIDNSQQEIR